MKNFKSRFSAARRTLPHKTIAQSEPRIDAAKILRPALAIMLLLSIALSPIEAISARNAWAPVALAPRTTLSTGSGQKSIVPTAKTPVKKLSGLQLKVTPIHASTAQAPAITPTSDLNEREIAFITERLPPLKASEKMEFSMREQAPKPPKPGAIIKQSFPPAVSHPAKTHNFKQSSKQAHIPLTIERFSPEGQINSATTELAVRFSQPMVKLSSIAETEKNAPITLSPKIAGTWRWVDTQTILFQPAQNRFPGSTHFAVIAPATIKSLPGNNLIKEKRWSFRTSTAQLIQSGPAGMIDSLMPVPFVCFDQPVDKREIGNKIHLTIKFDSQKTAHLHYPKDFTFAKLEEIKSLSNETWLQLKSFPEKKWVALKLSRKLPKSCDIQLTVSPGVKSLEGPLPTARPQSFEFSTYGPLRMLHPLGLPVTYPRQSIAITFTNSIDQQSFKPSMVKITPPMPGCVITTEASNICITGGKKKIDTEYKVTISPDLKDVYGQRLVASDSVSFTVKHYEHRLYVPHKGFTTLTPDMPQAISAYTVNWPELRVRAWDASPEDFVEPEVRRTVYDTGIVNQRIESAMEKRTPVLDRRYRLKCGSQLEETPIDLKKEFATGHRQLFMLVEPEPIEDGQYSNRQSEFLYVQYTNIGLSGLYDSESSRITARRLTDGQPIPGAKISYYPDRQNQQQGSMTDSGGTAIVDLQDSNSLLLVARKDDDMCLLPRQRYTDWSRKTKKDRLMWYAFTDRGVYRPGEEVRFKGWLRLSSAGPQGDIRGLDNTARAISYEVKDYSGNIVANGSAELDNRGGFTDSFRLPSTPQLGEFSIELKDARSQHEHSSEDLSFRVEEFRRPEFEVHLKQKCGSPLVFGEGLKMEENASYYSGGGLPRANVEWNINATSTSFAPAGWQEFHFGRYHRWWWERSTYGLSPAEIEEDSQSKTVVSKTNSCGDSSVDINIASLGRWAPVLISTQATVTDVNRQTRSTTSNVLMHPSTRYVGLKPRNSSFVESDAIEFSAIVTSIEGKICAGCPVTFGMYKLSDENNKRSLVEQTTRLSSTQPLQVKFAAKPKGCYVLSATVNDAQGRQHVSELLLYVWGTISDSSVKEIKLIPDKQVYSPGDTAEITVIAPFPKADGSLSLARSGLLSRSHFSMNSPHHVIKVPIKEEYLPNVHLIVDVSGQSAPPKGTFGPRTQRISSDIALNISRSSRGLQVKIRPEKELVEPGEVTTATVTVKNRDGVPLPGQQVCFMVVDEAVLSLTNYRLKDPLEQMYPARGSETNTVENYSSIELVNPNKNRAIATDAFLFATQNEISFFGHPQVSGGGSGGGGAGAPGQAVAAIFSEPRPLGFLPEVPPEGEPASNKIRIRTNFSPLATFKAALSTDEKGIVTVKYKLPDNLTRYRLMAVCADQNQKFGTDESSITARLPLMVRPSPPRFLNYGDKCLIPVVVQNQSGRDQTVNVVLRATIDSLEKGIGKKAKAPAGDRVEFLFPAKAGSAGTANFQTAVATAQHSDGSEFSMPVYTPASTETAATYGTINGDSDIAQQIQVPTASFRNFGGLEISTGSTALTEMTDAVLYMCNYQYSCSEQLSSKIMVFSGLADVARAFDMPNIKRNAVHMNDWISIVLDRQNTNGGFGLWGRAEDVEHPYLTVYACHALLRAKEHGYVVSSASLNQCLNYLQNIKRYMPSPQYNAAARRTILAYSLYVRKLMGDNQPDAAKALLQEAPLEEQAPETLAFLMMIFQNETKFAQPLRSISRFLANRIEETASTATINFSSQYAESAFQLYFTPLRGDALVLFALMECTPKSDLIQKLLKSLIRSRGDSGWSNTQENAFASLAIDRYFHNYEQQVPNFSADVWLGDTSIGGELFSGRQTETHQINVPMQLIAEKLANDTLVISKKGQGRLYYRLAMQYAPCNLRAAAKNCGFEVKRTYEPVDHPSDVQRGKDGVWHIKPGALVRVKVTMTANGRRHHVALVDPLPACFEILNQELEGTKKVDLNEHHGAGSSQDGTWWQFGDNRWWNHENLRDDRTEAFCITLWPGTYQYNFIARATSPGTFVAPPAKAEEMYETETFGRSSTDIVSVP